jgi:hypothetical protein
MLHITKSLLMWSFLNSIASPSVTFAQEVVHQSHRTVDTGVSGIWILANICYAGMRAQNNTSMGWRFVSFIFGLPGTIITYFAVKEGSERAYGIDIPRKK